MANKFSGKRIHALVTLVAIGKLDVLCRMQIISKVLICGHAVEIIFHVLPDDFLNNGILIGRDLLSLGFKIVMSPNGIDVHRIHTINLCDVGSKVVTFINLCLTNAPAVYQRAINNALGELANTYAICYLDDLIIPSVHVDEGLERLQNVLKALTTAGFY